MVEVKLYSKSADSLSLKFATRWRVTPTSEYQASSSRQPTSSRFVSSTKRSCALWERSSSNSQVCWSMGVPQPLVSMYNFKFCAYSCSCCSENLRHTIVASWQENVDALLIHGFLMQFLIGHVLRAVSGCRDLDTPRADTWVQRRGNTLMVKCNSSLDTWYLTCTDGRWVGQVGNCSLQGKGQ